MLPAVLAVAIEAGDFDAALGWLSANAWPVGSPVFDRAVVQVADVMISADPATSITLLLRLLPGVEEPLSRVHLLQRLLDAYARARMRSQMLATMSELDQVVVDWQSTSRFRY
jgi:hypothetical protein